MKYVCCVLVFFAPLVGVLSTSSSAEEPGRWHPLGEHTQETGRLAELGAKICLHAGDEPGCERFLKILARTDQHFTRKCNQGWGAKALREFQVDHGLLDPQPAASDLERAVATYNRALREAISLQTS